jgi:hypothetical protein
VQRAQGESEVRVVHGQAVEVLVRPLVAACRRLRRRLDTGAIRTDWRAEGPTAELWALSTGLRLLAGQPELARSLGRLHGSVRPNSRERTDRRPTTISGASSTAGVSQGVRAFPGVVDGVTQVELTEPVTAVRALEVPAPIAWS